MLRVCGGKSNVRARGKKADCGNATAVFRVDDVEALRRIRAARPFVSPNRGFLEQHGPELRFAGREEKLP